MSEGEHPTSNEPQSTVGWWLRILVAAVVIAGGVAGIVWYASRLP